MVAVYAAAAILIIITFQFPLDPLGFLISSLLTSKGNPIKISRKIVYCYFSLSEVMNYFNSLIQIETNH